MNKSLKILLSILLFLCLLDMPYGYYQLVRFVSFVLFTYFAYQSYSAKEEKFMFIYGALALLFQPFFKIALGAELWKAVDSIVAVGLLVTLNQRFNDWDKK